MKLKKLRRPDIYLFLFILILPMFVPKYAAAADNPSASYPYGLGSLADDRSVAKKMLISEWEDWKDSFLSKSGSKRVLPDGEYTWSEGMGYGLLLSVYFNEQTLFDELFAYVKRCMDANGLMIWLTKNGQVEGEGSSTDADQNIALALIFAHKIWGSDGSVDYEEEAAQMLNNIYQYDISMGQVKPGDLFGDRSTDPRNPSYLAPAAYEIFSDFDLSQRWSPVKSNAYIFIAKAQNPTTGLVPDWCDSNGSGLAFNGSSPDEFSYDSAKVFFNMAVAYSWYGHADAKTICSKATTFFKRIGATKIVDGYKLNGTPVGSYHNDLFVSSAAAGFMTGTDRQMATGFYKECIATKNSLCLGRTLRLLTLMYMSGNLQNLYKGGTQIVDTDSEAEEEATAEDEATGETDTGDEATDDTASEDEATDDAEQEIEPELEEEDMQITLKASGESGAVKLEWNNIEGITGYYIYKATSSGAQDDTPETDFCISGTTYKDTKVKPGTKYYYIVRPVLEDQTLGESSNEAFAAPRGGTQASQTGKPQGKSGTIELTIGNSMMKANGKNKAIDTVKGISPVISAGRTFVPVNAIIGEMGGKVTWNSKEQKVTIKVSDNTVELWIGKTTISVNGIKKTIDAAPYLGKKGTQMLPLRYVMESLGCDLIWENGTKPTVTIVYDFTF